MGIPRPVLEVWKDSAGAAGVEVGEGEEGLEVYCPACPSRVEKRDPVDARCIVGKARPVARDEWAAELLLKLLVVGNKEYA
jgi:hypothetical protein